MNTWINTLTSVFIVSLISLMGIVTMGITESKLKEIVLFFVSFSAGSLFGGAFIHLIPEAAARIGTGWWFSFYILAGIFIFFILEKFIYWRHCHIPTSEDHPHPLGTMNIVGDTFHNFIDGTVIAASYLVSPQLGFATTLAVALHEIPQELGEFGVLIHAGYSRLKAVLLNFLSSLSAVLGALVILMVGSKAEGFINIILLITAGGFIYIAGSDLIPELKKEASLSSSFFQFICIGMGVAIMFLVGLLGI